jgi:Cu(I)/Ag(I) efflux system membrane protein CusA/SilA
MSLAGIAISVGVLVDSSVVMAENAMHRLHQQFGDQPVRGDVRHVVLPACLAVGRPIVFSVVIMIVSFLPVFALEGIEGKMFRPLAYTKTLALAAVALLVITLVPVLCTIFIGGRLRSEGKSPLVRSFIAVYKPVLTFMLDRPGVLAWVLGVTLLVGFAPLGERTVTLGILFVAIAATASLARRRLGVVAGPAGLVLITLLCAEWIEPLPREFITPIDEGMIMDMPITVPRASITESVDDLKARDMVLCRFPEVDMVVGKAGRADTPMDPAPLDMIETMVNFRPREFWPRRKLRSVDAEGQVARVLEALVARGVIAAPTGSEARDRLIKQVSAAALFLFDAASREFAYHRNHELMRETRGVSPSSSDPSDAAEAASLPAWRRHMERLDEELLARAGPLFTRLAIDGILDQSTILDSSVTAHRAAAAVVRAKGVEVALGGGSSAGDASGDQHHHHSSASRWQPQLDPEMTLEELARETSEPFLKRLILWKADRAELTAYGGELDQAVQMPGWTNVWTMPIQNRVDMLATGVSTPIGIRVLGSKLEDVIQTSEQVARVVKEVPGAVDVVADPLRGKPTIEIRIDRERAAAVGVTAKDFDDVIEVGLAGRTATMTIEGRERHPVVVRYPRAAREDEESIRNLLVPARSGAQRVGASGGRVRQIPLHEIATVRVVEGPASIKGENGLLRNYVRFSAQGRDATELVAEARRAVESRVRLPAGVTLEWTGQYEHWLRARRTLSIIIPLVAALIFVILYLTYHDLADAALIMLAVPGAVAGGLFFQWLLAIPFSITVSVGYIACFGMATSTGIIMLVYLREAVAEAGGIESLSLAELRQAVVNGAVHRLRPKLLTEGTVVLGLAPLLWSSGVGSEVIRPMAAPVLGGILVADEVIDLLIPVLFYWVRSRRWRKLQAIRA